MNIDPNITKYLMKVKIVTDGIVEKPDVVGAIFGQTEGLLGDELDLRDLQKSGKIGRIEVDIESKGGKSEGTVYIPSGVDQVETSIVAASLETIDRIGPCKAKVEVLGVEDVRVAKREKVIERAKEILEKMMLNNKNLGEDLVQTVRSKVENAEIAAYGSDKLPGGPNLNSSESIIVVEGRNDVLNLLKFGIKNTIAVEGTNISKTITDLTKQKTSTAFLDGDRGGDLILKELLQVADIDFVARAPGGFEVEELTYKQVVKALRDKTPLDQYLASHGMQEELKTLNTKNESAPRRKEAEPVQVVANGDDRQNSSPVPIEGGQKPQGVKAYMKLLDEASQSKEVRFYDDAWEIIGKLPLNEVIEKFGSVDKKYTKIVTGGIVSQRLLDTAYTNGIREIYGIKLGHIAKRPADIKVITKEFGRN
ncbi:MAG: DNA primase DnaG [Thermoplasmatales archaeon]|jgi:DNA primase|nr:DNA primase DnaG [Candidatus Thermoplasmatota archaeon]MDA8054876.1 DNA primase DnaG [Thermoplasmatales archaeon]